MEKIRNIIHADLITMKGGEKGFILASVFAVYLIVFLVSMVPLIELRGAIPFGTAWCIPPWQCLIVACIGNMLPVPFIFFFARRIIHWKSI